MSEITFTIYVDGETALTIKTTEYEIPKGKESPDLGGAMKAAAEWIEKARNAGQKAYVAELIEHLNSATREEYVAPRRLHNAKDEANLAERGLEAVKDVNVRSPQEYAGPTVRYTQAALNPHDLVCIWGQFKPLTFLGYTENGMHAIVEDPRLPGSEPRQFVSPVSLFPWDGPAPLAVGDLVQDKRQPGKQLGWITAFDCHGGEVSAAVKLFEYPLARVLTPADLLERFGSTS